MQEVVSNCPDGRPQRIGKPHAEAHLPQGPHDKGRDGLAFLTRKGPIRTIGCNAPGGNLPDLGISRIRQDKFPIADFRVTHVVADGPLSDALDDGP